MAKKCRFVFSRKAFSEQVLKNETLRGRIRDSAEKANDDPERVWVRDHDGANRNGVAIICPAAVEAKHGTLENLIGRMSV